jgi:hypothetical protein
MSFVEPKTTATFPFSRGSEVLNAVAQDLNKERPALLQDSGFTERANEEFRGFSRSSQTIAATTAYRAIMLYSAGENAISRRKNIEIWSGFNWLSMDTISRREKKHKI